MFLCYSEFIVITMIFILVFIVGGIIFKIYIVGKSIKVVRQFALPNVSKCELEEVAGVFYFPRVFDVAAIINEADLDPSIAREKCFFKSNLNLMALD